MVQPKTPPLSIRPGEDRLAKIDAWATDHGLSRHAAILALLDLAMDQRAQAVFEAAKLEPPRQTIARIEYHSDEPPMRAERMEVVHFAVPVMQRKGFNPQPKKGKK